ncbi:S8 family serine peptidase [Bdellovibrionales bacterium]|nr:S8 family serine peptidase [Bdellovibrionales bacterium]
MVKQIKGFFLVALLSLCGWSDYAEGQAAFVPGEVIVKLRSTGKSSGAFLSKASTKLTMNLKQSWGKMNMHHFALKPGQSVESKVAELENDPSVEYAEPNYIFSRPDTESSPETLSYEEMQSEAQALGGGYLATGAPIHAQEIWSSLSVGSSQPIVAVIDTGVDINHPVFVGSQAIWVNSDEIPNNGIDDDANGYIDDVNGFNFVDNSGNMYDDDDHGTHVAGIILGVGQDIYTAPFEESKIKIMPLKFLDGNGVGTTSSAIKAIYYAIQNGASVINNSWGGPSYSAALHDAIVYSYNKGVSFLAASGNAGADNDFAPMYPASYQVPNIVSVAAITDFEQLASFSNFGKDSVHMGSPGVFIRSTVPGGGYRWMSGTSMATPFVAGTAALMLIEKPTMMGYQVKSLLMQSAHVSSGLYSKVSTEARLDVADSVHAAKLAAVDTEQPVYSSAAANRAMASNIAAGGCGLVAKMASDFRSGGGGRGPTGSPSALFVFFVVALLALPLILLNIMKNRTPESRRRYQRYDVNTEVKVSVDGRDLIGSVSSISLGGAQVNMDSMLQDGGVVNMSISTPNGKEQIEIEGHVVWREDAKSYGVQFEEDQDEALGKISRWTSALAGSKAS